MELLANNKIITLDSGSPAAKKQKRTLDFVSSAVTCDLCFDEKRSASKSCQQCMASYCEQHLQPHYCAPALKRHKLMEPVGNLHENICSRHNEVKKIFCRTDQKCICYLCHMDEHKDHDTVSAETDLSERKTMLREVQPLLNQTMQVIKGNIALLQEELRAIDRSADKVMSESDQLQQLVEQQCMNLREKVKKQKEIEKRRVEALLMKQKQELSVKSQFNTELEKMLHIESHAEFLKKCFARKTKCEDQTTTSTTALQKRPLQYFEQVSKDVSKLKNYCSRSIKSLAQSVREVDILLPQDPKTNDEFLHYSYQLTLDPNTARGGIVFSEMDSKVTSVREAKACRPHKDRFMDTSQVLSSNALPPRCYWEMDWTGLSITIGVTYKDIDRVGPKSRFGSQDNDKSWVLECQNKKVYIFKHNNIQKILKPCEFSRVGVFLDHIAGILIFYEVSETNKEICRVATKFTRPLYAGLGLYDYNVTATMCVKRVKYSHKH